MKNTLQFGPQRPDTDSQLLVFYGEHGIVLFTILVFKSLILGMFRFLNIIWSSFKMALQEFHSNKLRTFLSLLGITFGIFCIISVLAIISSMELALKTELKSIA